MVKGILVGSLCFILFLLLHVCIFHYRQIIKERFRLLKNIFFGLFPVYILLYVLIPTDVYVLIPADPLLTSKTVIGLSKVLNFSVGLMFYVFLFLGYCQFYFIVDRSISVRIMIELENSPKKQLTVEEIKKVYDFDRVLSRRLKHMVDGKYIIENSSYYKNTKKGRMEARIFKFLKEYLNLGPGG